VILPEIVGAQRVYLYCLLQALSCEEDNIDKLVVLQQFLEESRYQQFWHVFNKDPVYRDLMADAVGFENDIRRVIATTIAISYQNISTDLLQSYLNYGSPGSPNPEFSEFTRSSGWREADGIVHIPVNKDNEAKPTVIRENIKFDQLTKVIGYSNEL